MIEKLIVILIVSAIALATLAGGSKTVGKARDAVNKATQQHNYIEEVLNHG